MGGGLFAPVLYPESNHQAMSAFTTKADMWGALVHVC
jgi:hypothetical protein